MQDGVRQATCGRQACPQGAYVIAAIVDIRMCALVVWNSEHQDEEECRSFE